MKRRHLKYYLAVLAAIVAFGVYFPALQNGFVQWDDDAYVYENPHIRSFGPAFIKWAFSSFYASNWHPLTWISHALDYLVWGLNPMGHHLTNNILHAINTFIVVLLVMRLLARVQADRPASPVKDENPDSVRRKGETPPRQKKKRSGKSSSAHNSPLPPLSLRGGAEGGGVISDKSILITAATTGLLFGLHPIHVESVAWVSERKDLLCAAFFLLSIMVYMRYITPLSRSRGSYVLSLVFFSLALMSKPMAVSLPFVLLILDWYPFERIKSVRTFMSAVVEKLPFFALTLVSSVLTVMAQKSGGAILSVEEIPLSIRVLTSAKSLVGYLWKMIMPLNLVPFYPYPKDVSFFSAGYLFAVILVAGITILAFIAVKKQKLWLSVWSYYVITLIPVLGIIQVGSQAMADRYAYLPGIGLFFLIGLAAAWAYRKINMSTKQRFSINLFGFAAVIFLLISMSYMTIRQEGIWKNSMALWNYVIDKEPRTYFAYNNRGINLYAMGRIDEAVEDYRRAIALYPMYSKGHYNLGLAYYEKGFPDLAIEEYQTSLRQDPRNINAHLNLGVAYAKKGLTDKAQKEYQIVEKSDPGNPEPFYQLGSFFNNRGLLNEAIEQLRIAVSVKPDYADAHNNLAAALFKTGRFAEALEHYLIVSRLHPDDATTHSNLGSAYGAMGQLDKSIEQFQIAVRLNPGYTDAHYNLGMTYQMKGLMDQAIQQLEIAARLNPSDASLRDALARAYSLKNSGAR
jgi:tetratricopeptide (TPR) repeat protein